VADEKNEVPPRRAPLPDLVALHERHRGLTPAICGNYAEAACVCLSRHHVPPSTDFEVSAQGGDGLRALAWSGADERQKRAWNNADDATRDGAYALALAAVEVEHELLAVERADTRTGADYYLGGGGVADLEAAVRLEVSGVDRGDAGEVATRLRRKVKQAKDGKSDLPAMACVVGFKARRIAMARVASDG
jgi:hypothetical protein